MAGGACPILPCPGTQRHPPRAQVASAETVLAARCRRLYANAHTYHVNSIATSSDCETFISADDLRVNLWHLEVSDRAFNVVDIKPHNMEDLTEARIDFNALALG